ncbi:hypothetical protein HPB49_005153 [Dermacentor silvarum]|uniref:Uncharacterized protein n=1 Tax=Dermacentor silvarum TaxID=543639 RepID=A0ACB8CDE8_DERSI|nr:hypothetical protein HPB49_005153 [Dermacentor silvarum]
MVPLYPFGHRFRLDEIVFRWNQSLALRLWPWLDQTPEPEPTPAAQPLPPRQAGVPSAQALSDKKVSVRPVREAYLRDCGVRTLKVMPKLTETHLDPNSFEKMRVTYAFQLFGSYVLRGLAFYKEEIEKRCGRIEATQGFFAKINRLITVMTSRFRAEALRPASSDAAFLADFLDYLDKWEACNPDKRHFLTPLFYFEKQPRPPLAPRKLRSPSSPVTLGTIRTAEENSGRRTALVDCKKSSDPNDLPRMEPDGCWSWVVAVACSCMNFFSVVMIRSAGVVYVSVVENFAVTRQEAAWPISVVPASANLIGGYPRNTREPILDLPGI